MVNVLTGLYDLKTKEDDLDVGKLKTVPADLKKSSDVVRKEVIGRHNKLNSKIKFRKWNSWCVYFNSNKPIQHR